jgi:transcriptional regulator with XRE-family HTH domain
VKNRPHQNIVGPQIRKLRFQRGWSQAQMATKLQIIGCDFEREHVAKIECQTRRMRDTELPFIARVLGVAISELFPDFGPPNVPVVNVIEKLTSKMPRRKVVPPVVQPPSAIQINCG